MKNQTTGFIKQFAIQLIPDDDGSARINVMAPNCTDENSKRQSNWIGNIFMPKISKWIISLEENYKEKSSSEFESIDSLSLIDLSEYNQLYNDLKVKYGENMVKVCMLNMFFG